MNLCSYVILCKLFNETRTSVRARARSRARTRTEKSRTWRKFVAALGDLEHDLCFSKPSRGLATLKVETSGVGHHLHSLHLWPDRHRQLMARVVLIPKSTNIKQEY